jgi:predicted GNAT family acetyltransferase
MARETNPYTIVNTPGRSRGDDAGRFTLSEGTTKRGHLSYTLPDAITMNIDYVEVDPALRGQGVGKQLVDAAVEWAEANGRRVVPLCSYARAVLARAKSRA